VLATKRAARRFPPPLSVKEIKHHNSKAVGHAKTGGFALLSDEYRLGDRYSSSNREAPWVSISLGLFSLRGPVQTKKHNPTAIGFKRVIALCPTPLRRRGLSRNWTTTLFISLKQATKSVGEAIANSIIVDIASFGVFWWHQKLGDARRDPPRLSRVSSLAADRRPGSYSK
jgi:hypothetical protein